MAVDRGYGSGKPRSAANSRARQRVAKGQMTKGKKGNAALLKKVAAENPVTGFIGGGILPAKLLKAASSLVATGQVAKASAVKARLAARLEGQRMTGNVNDVAMRNQSTSVFPRIGSTANNTKTLRQEYLAAKQGYQQVFGRGSKMGPFNPDVAAMTSYPGRGVSAAKIRKISNQVDAYLAKRSNVSEGTLNIVDTRRMNPAQAKSALEGGVSQTAKIKRRVPSAPKKVNKVTKRLLGGR